MRGWRPITSNALVGAVAVATLLSLWFLRSVSSAGASQQAGPSLLVLGVVVAALGAWLVAFATTGGNTRPADANLATVASADCDLHEFFPLVIDADTAWLLVASVVDLDADADLFEPWFLAGVESVEESLDLELAALLKAVEIDGPDFGENA